MLILLMLIAYLDRYSREFLFSKKKVRKPFIMKGSRWRTYIYVDKITQIPGL